MVIAASVRILRHPSQLRSERVDPRIERSRAAVLDAAADLLVEGGPNAVTIDAIVARSGVAKSTIYRHWPTRDEVLLAVIDATAPHLPRPDPDADVVTSLRTILRAAAATLNDPRWARMVPALMLLKHHEAGIKEIDDRLEHERHSVVTSLIERAAEQGVVAAGVDASEAVAELFGPLLFAHLTGTAAVDDGFADRTLDRFLAAHHPAT
jgi:TetR/AcrR family transcriptional regulator, regulator of autoinduction and epiphytic fitness